MILKLLISLPIIMIMGACVALLVIDQRDRFLDSYPGEGG
jgi:hypothetical protein